MKTKFATLIVACALALALVSPTLLNSFGPESKGWSVQFLNPANPTQSIILVGYAAMITLLALAAGKLGTSVGKLSAFLGITIAGAGVLAVTFVAMFFFLELGGQYASKTFAEEWSTWMRLGAQGFIIAHVAMAIGASVLGLTLGIRMFSAGNSPTIGTGTVTAGDPDPGVVARPRTSIWRFWAKRRATC